LPRPFSFLGAGRGAERSPEEVSAIQLERVPFTGLDTTPYPDTSTQKPQPFITTHFRHHAIDILQNLSQLQGVPKIWLPGVNKNFCA